MLYINPSFGLFVQILREEIACGLPHGLQDRDHPSALQRLSLFAFRTFNGRNMPVQQPQGMFAVAVVAPAELRDHLALFFADFNFVIPNVHHLKILPFGLRTHDDDLPESP